MVSFGSRRIGDGFPCFITFEAGPTHDGLASAERLVDAAAEAGADAVKFQLLDPDRLVADRALPFSYDVLVDRSTGRTETVTEPLHDILCRRTLSTSEWRTLKRHCDDAEIAFFATALFEDEVDFLAGLGCDSVKIASADVNHLPLLRHAARTGVCLQLDTGSATIGEIETAVDVIRAEGNENIIIHHCPSGYPARLASINLNVIGTLRRMFPFPIAFSDHTPGWDMDIAALALGARLLEKTISEDRTTRSIEHIMSLEPGDMVAFVQSIRAVETALGSPRRILHPEEEVRRRSVRRSAFMKTVVSKGQRFDQSLVDFRRPGHGISPDRIDELSGAVFRTDVREGALLRREDLEWPDE